MNRARRRPNIAILLARPNTDFRMHYTDQKGTKVNSHRSQFTYPRAALVALLVVLSSMLGGSTAHAYDNYVFSGPLGGNGPHEEKIFGHVTRIAVDGATGNVLVPDGGRVQVWSPAGEAPSASTMIGSFGAGELSGTYGVAVDQNNGDVYVSDATHIARYSVSYPIPEEPTVPNYTLDPGFTSPSTGSDASVGQVGSFASPIAVDPGNGDLLVADTGNNYVERFDSSGAFVSAFNGADTTAGAFQGLIDIAVGGNGTTYLIDSLGGATRVERFDAVGVSQGELPESDDLVQARAIAYGQTTGDVFVETGDAPVNLYIFDTGAPRRHLSVPLEFPLFQRTAVGLAVDDATATNSGNVYMLFFEPAVDYPSLAVFDRQRQPDATLDPPSDVTPNSVHLSGTVDAVGSGLATFAFELSSDGGATWTPVIDESADAGQTESVSHPVSESTNLLENVEYKARLSATNINGTHTSEIQTFTTGTSPPGVGGERVTERETDSATLRGSVNPRGLQTTYHFDYGLTTAYGSAVPTGNEATLGNGHGERGVAQLLRGLQPNTTYHYRLVARNAAGETTGADRTFTTPAVAGFQRAYELVSPAAKGGNSVSFLSQGFQMGSDGNNAVFSGGGTTLLGVGSETAPLYPRYVAHRTEGGWSTKAVDPPQKENLQIAISYTLAVSDDGTKAIVMSKRKLAEGAVEGDTNTYLRDVATGEYTTMTTTPSALYFSQQTGFFQSEVVAGTPNFDHVLLWAKIEFGVGISFLPGAPPNALYEFTDGQLHLASVLPDGTPSTGTGGDKWDHDPYRMSADGSRVFFEGADGVVYVRIGGTTTQVVSASRRSVDDGTAQPGNFLSATADGRFAYIYGHDLTDDSEPDVTSLYRYSVDDDDLQLLTKVATSPGTPKGPIYGSAIDGDTLYFLSNDGLDGNSTSGSNIYVWRDGVLSHVASLDQSRDFALAWGTYNWRVSRNGRYFIFAANSQLTEYDNSIPQPPTVCRDFAEGDPGTACREIYRYDADTGTLLCASCRPDGIPPAGHSTTGQTQLDIGTRTFPHGVTNSGQVFFDTPDPLVARDTNGARDVYEFDGTEPHLISSGRGSDSQFEGASLDGSSVFFTTQNPLVKADTDNATDLYVARVGGGFASQNAEPAVPCSGEGCRAAAAPPSPPPPGGSEAASGPGNASPRKKHRCGKGRHKQKIKGKTRCVKQHKANHNRRQGR